MTMRVLKTVVMYGLAAFMVGIGITHFTSTDDFVSIVPAFLPAPRLLVYISGVAEICGGLGLLWSRTRKAAAWGLILLYIAVFPANINMAVNHLPLAGKEVSATFLWLRLPFQLVFIALAAWFRK